MTEDKGNWCNAFDGLALRVYAKLKLEYTRLLNVIDYVKMAANQKYI